MQVPFMAEVQPSMDDRDGSLERDGFLDEELHRLIEGDEEDRQEQNPGEGHRLTRSQLQGG